MALDKQLQEKMYQSKRVIVRIWTSGGNISHPGESVGHVSIETPTQYMSLWPRQARHPNEEPAKGSEGLGINSPISHELLVNVKKDYEYEGRPPEVIYCFYTLDVDEIEKEFRAVQQTLKGWSLLALCEGAESCASLAGRLLQAGGISKLVSVVDKSSVAAQGSTQGFWAAAQQGSAGSGYAMASQPENAAKAGDTSKANSFYSVEMGVGCVITSPDYLAELLGIAKKEELEKAPNTKELFFESETQVNASSQEKCSIM